MLDVNMIIANNIQAELKKENKKQVDARKKEIALEMLRYPIHDDELWACRGFRRRQLL